MVGSTPLLTKKAVKKLATVYANIHISTSTTKTVQRGIYWREFI